MYLDDTINLDFYIPSDLAEYIDEVEKSYAQKNDIRFDDAMEMVEVLAKAYAKDRTISYSDMHKIKEKYGGW